MTGVVCSGGANRKQDQNLERLMTTRDTSASAARSLPDRPGRYVHLFTTAVEGEAHDILNLRADR